MEIPLILDKEPLVVAVLGSKLRLKMAEAQRRTCKMDLQDADSK